MRGGWITCPPPYRHGLRIASKMLAGSLPFLLAEASARLVMSGQAFELRQRSVDEFNARQDLADTALAGFDYNSCRNTPFVWLAVPEPWNSGTFKAAALQNGVIVDDEDEFKAGRSDKVFHRVRIGLGPSHPREEVKRGLAVIRRLLEEGRTSYEKFD
jgi:DNA-binding transcriptional MocR family regulator